MAKERQPRTCLNTIFGWPLALEEISMKKLTSSGSTKTLQAKNFGLSPEDFQQLVDELHAGKDELYQQVFLEHFEDCMKYLKRQYRATHADAYDASMDTLLVFCDRLKKGRIQYGNLRFLFTQMAGQVYIKQQKKRTRYTEIPDNLDLIDDEHIDIPQAAFDAFDSAWPELGEGCQKLLKAFFYDKVKLKDIAQQQGKSEAALRKQKQRCMGKLQAIFKRQYQH